MRLIEGHLTQTNKSHIKAILSLDLLLGKINRTEYHLLPLEGGVYSCTIITNERHCIGAELKRTIHKSKFKL